MRLIYGHLLMEGTFVDPGACREVDCSSCGGVASCSRGSLLFEQGVAAARGSLAFAC